MRFVGYDRGDEAQIEMRDGSRIQGVIPYASEKGFILRQRGEGSNGSELVPISAFSQAQIWDIFAFYAEKRAEMASGKRLSARDREEIFHEYLRLAILCDWYNDETKAQEYVQAALDTMQQAGAISLFLSRRERAFRINSKLACNPISPKQQPYKKSVILSANFLFFGKDFLQNGVYVSPLAGLKIIIRLTQGFATLTLGFYVAGPLGRQYDAHQPPSTTSTLSTTSTAAAKRQKPVG
jgi:hypothetical protein